MTLPGLTLPGLALAALVPASLGAVSPSAGPPDYDVSITVTGLRSPKGQVLACLTARPAAFPSCASDPAARRLRMPAGTGTLRLDFGPVPEGRYAVAIIHDENGNGRMDKRLMMPAEGFGFSRDAPVVMGPPSFSRAAFDVRPPEEHLSIRMRYML